MPVEKFRNLLIGLTRLQNFGIKHAVAVSNLYKPIQKAVYTALRLIADALPRSIVTS